MLDEGQNSQYRHMEIDDLDSDRSETIIEFLKSQYKIVYIYVLQVCVEKFLLRISHGKEVWRSSTFWL